MSPARSHHDHALAAGPSILPKPRRPIRLAGALATLLLGLSLLTHAPAARACPVPENTDVARTAPATAAAPQDCTEAGMVAGVLNALMANLVTFGRTLIDGASAMGLSFVHDDTTFAAPLELRGETRLTPYATLAWAREVLSERPSRLSARFAGAPQLDDAIDTPWLDHDRLIVNAGLSYALNRSNVALFAGYQGAFIKDTRIDALRAGLTLHW